MRGKGGSGGERARRFCCPGETGEIAVALITGEQGGISEEVKQAMRDSGFAHILSISGLHMVIGNGRRPARSTRALGLVIAA